MILRWWNPISWFAVPTVAIARGIRGLFPWTQDGRRTSLYVAALGAGPALTAIVVWVMWTSLQFRLFDTFSKVAFSVAASLFVIVCAIGVGTGLNIFAKAGKGGVEFGAGGDDDVAKAAHQVADAAQEKAVEIEQEGLTSTDPEPVVEPEAPTYQEIKP